MRSSPRWESTRISSARQRVAGRHVVRGLTAYSRSPARGVWKSGQSTKLDDIVVIEIMTAELKRSWWKKYRRELATLYVLKPLVFGVFARFSGSPPASYRLAPAGTSAPLWCAKGGWTK